MTTATFVTVIVLLAYITLPSECLVCQFTPTALYENCKYCGFANISGGVSKTIEYYCLATLDFPILDAPKAILNQCVTSEVTFGGITFGYALYACDHDLCNDGCYYDDSFDSTTHGNAGSTVEISVAICLLSALFYSANRHLF